MGFFIGLFVGAAVAVLVAIFKPEWFAKAKKEIEEEVR